MTKYEIITDDGEDIEICFANSIFANDEEVSLTVELDGLDRQCGWDAVNDFMSYFNDSSGDLKALCLRSLYNYYQDEIMPRKKDYEDTFSITLEKLDSPDQIEALVELVDISIFPNESAGVGLSFHCQWDEEHGVGIRLREQKVLGVGKADYAFR